MTKVYFAKDIRVIRLSSSYICIVYIIAIYIRPKNQLNAFRYTKMTDFFINLIVISTFKFVSKIFEAFQNLGMFSPWIQTYLKCKSFCCNELNELSNFWYTHLKNWISSVWLHLILYLIFFYLKVLQKLGSLALTRLSWFKFILYLRLYKNYETIKF